MKFLGPFSPTVPDAMAVSGGFFMFLAASAAISFLANRHYVEAAASQPVEFNHLVHVEGEGLECSSCHGYYEDETRSGFPTAAMCSLCHMEPIGESAAEQKLVSLLEAGAVLEWDSLFRQPPHVFFSHRRHVAVAELECVTCHGGIGSSERSPREKQPLGMQECIDCHTREGISESCTKCHR